LRHHHTEDGSFNKNNDLLVAILVARNSINLFDLTAIGNRIHRCGAFARFDALK